MKSMFKAVAIVTVFSILTRALGFLFRIFLSRKLGAEGLGLFQMAMSVMGIFTTLIASGIPLSTAKFVSVYQTNNQLKKRNQIVTSALVISLLITLVTSLLIYLLRSVWGIILTDNRVVAVLITLIPSLIFSAVYCVFRGALWGQADYFNCGLTEFIEQILRFLFTFILIIHVTDLMQLVTKSAVAYNLTCLLSAGIASFIYLKKAKLDFRRGEYINLIKSSAPVTGIRLANSLVQPLTAIIIPSMLVLTGYTSSEAVASYGVIMGMTFPMLFVPMAVIGSISMVLIPSISSMLSKNDYSSIQNNIQSSIEISLLISMIFIPLYLSVGNLIGVVLFNNATSGVLLQLSAVCVLPITLCNLTGSILNALNLEVKSFINYISGSAILLLGLVVFTPILGINSVIVSFFLSMTIITILNLKKIKHALPNIKLDVLSTSTKYSLIIIPCSFLGHFIANVCLCIFGNFVSCVIGGMIAIICTLALANMFKLCDIKKVINTVLSKKLNKKYKKGNL